MFNRFPKLKPVSDVLVGNDEDETVFTITHPKHLSLFASPLVDEREASAHKRSHADALLTNKSHHNIHESEKYHEDEEEDNDPEVPVLKRAHEASTIQLFYDLFFVANLTTFTAAHEIDDKNTLKSYIGFFSILWFTWFQVALFDVRFSNDSVFERITKALQFGVMTGFAVVGPNYQTSWEDDKAGARALQAFQTLSLILMASRLVLACQYGAAYWWLRNYRKAHVPLLAHIGTLFVAAMIYLGLYFSFGKALSGSGLVAWYVAIGFEAAVILLVSGRTRFLSLRRTAIVERLGLLTLIILGEGIIGLCGSVGKVGIDGIFSSDVIGMIISSVAIIYFIWMLYFDQEETTHVGTLRQQFWTILHFPFHITVLLVVEGLNRLSVWTKILDVTTPLLDKFTPFLEGNPPTGNNMTELITYLNETLQPLFEQFSSNQLVQAPNITDALELIRESTDNVTFSDSVFELLSEGFNFVCENVGVEPPKEFKTGDPTSALAGIFDLFNTVFVYFFICAGLCLIFLAILFWTGKRRKLRGEILAIGVRILVGLGLSLLTLMDLPQYQNEDNSAINTYLYTPWMLPTVVICYGLVVLIDNILIHYVRKVVSKRRRGDHV
ncbi:hypothetical protein MMC13_002982 [Lambiella insularis]|nr:hypothetical protein [Lambiella insularis]